MEADIYSRKSAFLNRQKSVVDNRESFSMETHVGTASTDLMDTHLGTSSRDPQLQNEEYVQVVI